MGGMQPARLTALSYGVVPATATAVKGTAFPVAPNLFVTAAHVVRDARTAELRHGGYASIATVMRLDERLDAALLLADRPIAEDGVAPVAEAGVQHVTAQFAATGWPQSRPFAADPVTVAGWVVDVGATIFDGAPAIQLFCREVSADLDPHGFSGAAVSVFRPDGAVETIGLVRWSPVTPRMSVDGGILYASPLVPALEVLTADLPEPQRIQIGSWRHRALDVAPPRYDQEITQPADVALRPPGAARMPWTKATATGRRHGDALAAIGPEMRTLVIGGAGLGKSTLLARLAADAAVPAEHVVDLSRVTDLGPDARAFPQWHRGGRQMLLVDAVDRVSVDRQVLAESVLAWPAWAVAARSLAEVPLDLRRAADQLVRLTPLDEDAARALLKRWAGPEIAETVRRHGLPTRREPVALYRIPAYLRLIAQAGLPATVGGAADLMDHFADVLLGPTGVRADVRCPTGLTGVLGALETLAYRLTGSGRSYLAGEEPAVGAVASAAELTAAAAAGLIENSQLVGFTHDLWREHFAARQLRRAVRSRRNCREFFAGPWWHPTPWREVVEAVSAAEPVVVARWLLPCRPLEAVRLAPEVGGDPAGRERVAAAVADAQTRSEPAVRVRAAELQDLANPGARQGVWCRDGIPDVWWSEERDGLAIARYPTTNAQWSAYLAAVGADPHDGRPPTAPVVEVSWVEADAYCAWLADRLAIQVRLPTVAEWERFAAGPPDKPYPFGDWRPYAANTRAAKLGGPSVAGAFPGSEAPCGAADLVGNVWEWCAGDDPDTAPAKGGSWAGYTHHATIGSTVRLPRPGRYDDVGFRVLRGEETTR